MRAPLFILTFLVVTQVYCCNGLVPPRFEWKVIDFAWENFDNRDIALANRFYIPEGNLPTGLARWKDKLFITIPRWKKGVPSSLNYVNLTASGPPNQPLHPYPSWRAGFLPDNACCAVSNSTVVSAFRPHVDSCNRLWVADNGASNMMRENAEEVRQIVSPSIMAFDLETDTLVHKFELPAEVLKDSSVLSSIVVDTLDPTSKSKDCNNSFVYVTDMGANSLIVYSLGTQTAWRVESPFFHFDPHASTYIVGGIEFFWHDGVSSATLGPVGSNGYRDLYLQPTSSTKLFKVSTKLLRNQTTHPSEYFGGVQIVGDRGPESQVTACDYDQSTNVLFFTQLSKNGVGCWSLDKEFTEENHPDIFNDCKLLEFPNDIKIDDNGKMWVISDRQQLFQHKAMDFNTENFRIFELSVDEIIKNTTCWAEGIKPPTQTGNESTSGSSSYETSESGSSSSYSNESEPIRAKTDKSRILARRVSKISTPKSTTFLEIGDKSVKKEDKDASYNNPVVEKSSMTDLHKQIPVSATSDLPVSNSMQKIYTSGNNLKLSNLPSLPVLVPNVTEKFKEPVKAETSTEPKKVLNPHLQLIKDKLLGVIDPSKAVPPKKNKDFGFKLQVDFDKNIWILSDRQSRFLYEGIDPDEVNFRVLTAPVPEFIQDTTCESPGILTILARAIGLSKSPQYMYAGPSSQLPESRTDQQQPCQPSPVKPVLNHQQLIEKSQQLQQPSADVPDHKIKEDNRNKKLPKKNQAPAKKSPTTVNQSKNVNQQDRDQKEKPSGFGCCPVVKDEYINKSKINSEQNEEIEFEDPKLCGFECCPIVKQLKLNKESPEEMVTVITVNQKKSICQNQNQLFSFADHNQTSVPQTEDKHNQTFSSPNEDQSVRESDGVRQNKRISIANQGQTMDQTRTYNRKPYSFINPDQTNLPLVGVKQVQSEPSLVVSQRENPLRLPLVGDLRSKKQHQASTQLSQVCAVDQCESTDEHSPDAQPCCEDEQSIECCEEDLQDQSCHLCCDDDQIVNTTTCCPMPEDIQYKQQICCEEEEYVQSVCCVSNKNLQKMPSPSIKKLSLSQLRSDQPTAITAGITNQQFNQSFGQPLACSSKINQSISSSPDFTSKCAHCTNIPPVNNNAMLSKTYIAKDKRISQGQPVVQPLRGSVGNIDHSLNQTFGQPIAYSTKIDQSLNQSNAPFHHDATKCPHCLSMDRSSLENTEIDQSFSAERPKTSSKTQCQMNESMGPPIACSTRIERPSMDQKVKQGHCRQSIGSYTKIDQSNMPPPIASSTKKSQPPDVENNRRPSRQSAEQLTDEPPLDCFSKCDHCTTKKCSETRNKSQKDGTKKTQNKKK